MQTVPGHPILGHLGALRRDRAGTLMRIGREHDAAKIRIGVVPIDFVVIGSAQLANEILTTKQESFRKAPGLTVFLRPVLGDGLLTSDGEVHARARKLLAPAFAPKRVASYAETMVVRAERFASALREGQTLDLAEAMMRLTFDIVGKTLFDAEVDDDATEVGEALTTVMECVIAQIGSIVPVPPSIPTPTNLRLRRARARLDRVIYRVIRERRASAEDRGDVLSMLLAARDEHGAAMTDAQIRDESMTLFLAGHETTANALAWAFYLLARHPEARANVEAEVDALGRAPTYEDLPALPYTLAVLKESLRLYPPAYLLARRALEDVTIGGHVIAKGSICLVSVIGIHRRESLWPDADRFDPSRFLGDREKLLPRCAYVPFGAGPRICIGNHFALMEGHALLATIARHARFELESEAPIAMEPLVTLRPKGGLPVRVSTRGRAPRSEPRVA